MKEKQIKMKFKEKKKNLKSDKESFVCLCIFGFGDFISTDKLMRRQKEKREKSFVNKIKLHKHIHHEFH